MKRIFCFITLIFISPYLYSQGDLIEDAMNRQIQEISIESALNKQIQVSSNINSRSRSILNRLLVTSFYEGWSRRTGAGLTNYKSLFTESVTESISDLTFSISDLT